MHTLSYNCTNMATVGRSSVADWDGGMSVCCTAGPIVRYCGHGIISSCQSTATSEAVKRCWSWALTMSWVYSCVSNQDKTKKIVITGLQQVECERHHAPPRPEVVRISSLRVLGVTVNDKLTAVDHVTTFCRRVPAWYMPCQCCAARTRQCTPTTSLQWLHDILFHSLKLFIYILFVSCKRLETYRPNTVNCTVTVCLPIRLPCFAGRRNWNDDTTKLPVSKVHWT